jgi:thiamine-phosphate pyrophosphorylase
VLVLSDRRQAAAAGRSLPDIVEAIASVDDVWFLYRERDLPVDERGLEKAVGFMASRCEVPLVVASGAADPHDVQAVGVHLAAAARAPAERPPVLGRSCHGLHDLVAAEREDVDYVTLSPIYETTSKPGYGPARGLDGLRALTSAVELPTYALGGVVPGLAAPCIGAGAYGVAVMGGVMAAEDPTEVVAQLVAEVHDARSGSAG